MIEKIGIPKESLNPNDTKEVDIRVLQFKINEIIDEVNKLKSMKLELRNCEHNLIDYQYPGAWSGSVPPPNKKCTKCLTEFRT